MISLQHNKTLEVYYSIKFLKFWGFDWMIPILRKEGDDKLIETVSSMAEALPEDDD